MNDECWMNSRFAIFRTPYSVSIFLILLFITHHSSFIIHPFFSPLSPLPSPLPMSDRQTTVAELRELVEAFVERRDWHQFHAPKNLAMSLAIEAAELMEHFQWISPEDSRRVAEDAEQLSRWPRNWPSVLCYALAMANELKLDLSGADSAENGEKRRKVSRRRIPRPGEIMPLGAFLLLTG